MKKILALLLALAMTLSLAACGSSSSSTTDDSASSAAGSDTATEDTSAAADETAETADVSGETYTVGIVNWVDDASLNQIVENIQTELEAKGEELGCTFEVNYDNAQADSTVLNQIGADMVASQVDVIVAVATPVATVMQAATEDTDIPVVFSAVSDPVGAGLVESMDEPGGNVTGTSDALDTTAIMNLMLAANPDLELVGLLYDSSQDSSTQAIEDAKAWCQEAGVEYEEKTGSTTDDILLATQSLISDGVDAIFTPSDNTVMTAELTIYELLQEAQIPHYAGADSFALNGAFCGYGVDYANLGVMTADMVVDLLVNDADPATTPVMTFDNGIATINTETCEAIGFDLETIKETFAPLCTEVVEIQTAEEFE
ncbi:MAG: ABC transporter substrate-binding protein [Clostridiales bacterium]|nr:ABC transporter substrate-binding protein [Clostridiales bacterium]